MNDKTKDFRRTLNVNATPKNFTTDYVQKSLRVYVLETTLKYKVSKKRTLFLRLNLGFWLEYHVIARWLQTITFCDDLRWAIPVGTGWDFLTCTSFRGGYVLKPQRFEFWAGQTTRLHDRFVFRKLGDGEIPGELSKCLADGWVLERWAP